MRVCIVSFIYHYVLEKKLDVKEADIEFSRLHSTMVFHGAHICTCAGIYGRNQTSYWHKLDSKKNQNWDNFAGKNNFISSFSLTRKNIIKSLLLSCSSSTPLWRRAKLTWEESNKTNQIEIEFYTHLWNVFDTWSPSKISLSFKIGSNWTFLGHINHWLATKKRISRVLKLYFRCEN